MSWRHGRTSAGREEEERLVDRAGLVGCTTGNRVASNEITKRTQYVSPFKCLLFHHPYVNLFPHAQMPKRNIKGSSITS